MTLARGVDRLPIGQRLRYLIERAMEGARFIAQQIAIHERAIDHLPMVIAARGHAHRYERIDQPLQLNMAVLVAQIGEGSAL